MAQLFLPDDMATAAMAVGKMNLYEHRGSLTLCQHLPHLKPADNSFSQQHPPYQD